MRICPKCLTVYPFSSDLYCTKDGEQTIDTDDKAAEPYLKKVKAQVSRDKNRIDYDVL